MDRIREVDRFVSLSRRDLVPPWYRITRSDLFDPDEKINPWKQRDRLPLYDRGLLGELIYGDEPRIIDDLKAARPRRPGGALRGHALAPGHPQLRQRRRAEHGRDDGPSPAPVPIRCPSAVWMSNLFGRATQNLVLRDEMQTAYDVVDRELKVVADIQRSLLPTELPQIPTLDLAAYYQTSTPRAATTTTSSRCPTGGGAS